MLMLIYPAKWFSVLPRHTEYIAGKANGILGMLSPKLIVGWPFVTPRTRPPPKKKYIWHDLVLYDI